MSELQTWESLGMASFLGLPVAICYSFKKESTEVCHLLHKGVWSGLNRFRCGFLQLEKPYGFYDWEHGSYDFKMFSI